MHLAIYIMILSMLHKSQYFYIFSQIQKYLISLEMRAILFMRPKNIYDEKLKQYIIEMK